MSPRVFIGMPVRNGARFVATAVQSLQSQSFLDWRLLISDNASTDDTVSICRELAARDNRISVVTQERDIGAGQNFRFVLNKAHGDLFMWAAADDIWHPAFLKVCVSTLNASPDRGMAFTGIKNIDSHGRVLRQYPHLAKLSGPPSHLTISRFLLLPEILGKANLIYGIYRLSLCHEVMERVGFPDCWGSDMVFVLGVMARAGIYIDPRVLFQKRIDESRETVDAFAVKPKFMPGNGLFPLDAYPAYLAGLMLAVQGTGFEATTRILMEYRYRCALLSIRLQNLRAQMRARLG